MDDLEFILLDRSGALVKAWNDAFAELVPDNIRGKFTTVSSMLSALESPHNQFDCIVSPANSYGFLDGGQVLSPIAMIFDHYISETLSPNDYHEPTRHVQSVLYDRWRGFAPPGTCTIIPLEGSTCAKNQHQCSFIALCPTMRVPEVVTWNRELVYNVMWSLLVSLDQHNRAVNDSGKGTPIRKVLMTGLGTATGYISAERCARQMASAIRDFAEACAQPKKWKSLTWSDAYGYANEGKSTHAL
ncbi:hypothetical protein GALMADRAFT_61988 [Galerina marginata CBS 339.88]|uniref:Macro-like domain-containing protein n=1 Tax=Galerina marginata (strain CBS 339.88) TaxID=685588 RepID=A0A067TAH2_GALM3|nr:hypothetical protein GALMADRAFT_61988 [Galerina marginata CBS 339.88]